MSKDELYVYLVAELEDSGTSTPDMPSIETFLHVWRKDFPHLKIPRYNTLGSCGDCLMFKLEMAEVSLFYKLLLS